MDKIIVTHFNPDLDAICAIWLLKRHDKEMKASQVEFVSAGQTWRGQIVDVNPNIIHVDTGLGKFDHHQLTKKTCAAQLVFNYLKSANKNLKNDLALIRLIKVVKAIDNFEECLWPESNADYFNFNLHEVLKGLKSCSIAQDQDLIEFGLKSLTAVYSSLKIKINAEKELRKGYQFKTKWGKAIGCLTHNDQVLKVGQKQGFTLVVQKDSRTEHIRIKARPDSKVDLTKVKNKLLQLDPKASWFLHSSKKMLLNGSSKNTQMKASKLSLKKVISILEENEA